MEEDKMKELKAVTKELEAKIAELIKSNKELETKNAELERFAYTVSHDLKAPLVTLQGFVGLLREDFEQNRKEQGERNLKYIESSAAKMQDLLTGILELSRIGRVVNPPEDAPFGEIVHDALEQIAEQVRSPAVRIYWPVSFPTVHVDRMRIAEALVNLITNSIKYRDEQRTPEIEIGYWTEDEENVFFIKDNGIGIDPGKCEKVFDLFYRATEISEGTGAGLAIVKRIIEAHEGRIWIESEKGKGCTVYFTLPAR